MIVAAVILGGLAFGVKGAIFALLVQGLGILTAVIGIFAVTPRSDTEHGMRAINRGFFLSALLAAAGVLGLAGLYLKEYKAFWAVLIGLGLASVIQLLTEHYTSTRRRPVQEIAESSLTGPATTILSGFATGLEATVWAILTIVGAIVGAYYLGHSGGLNEELYYVSLIGMGMLATVGVVVSMDTYGPVTDNAQGIAEMSGDVTGEGARTLEELDGIGNTTKAITKGVAIATAVLAATSLFGAFAAKPGVAHISVNHPLVLAGMLVGGSIAFLFASLLIRAVGRAASQVVVEVRAQF